MLNFSDALLLILPIYILLLIWGIIKKYSISKHILLFGMGVYITLVIAITLFPLPTSIEFIQLMRLDNISTNNLIPFKSIYNLIKLNTVNVILKNILGNILLLVPLGFIIPLMQKKFTNIKSIFISSLIFSLIIESMQFIISIILGYNYKVVDIDDIILNIMGGIIGYILYKLVCIIFELNDKKIRQKNL